MKNQKLNARLGHILGQVGQRGSISIAELARALDVSEETVRRDAKILTERGDVLKLHGSLAVPHHVGEAPFERRMRENAEAKRAIARQAVQLVEDGDSLIIDTGTTTSIFAQELRNRRALTVVTNSSDIARTLATVNGNRVYMAGGELKADNGAAFGPAAVEFISRFRVKHVFLSVAALSAIDGPMDADLAEADFALRALHRADHRVILTDSSKFDRTALAHVCKLEDINQIVCDRAPTGALLESLHAAQVTITLAQEPARNPLGAVHPE